MSARKNSRLCCIRQDGVSKHAGRDGFGARVVFRGPSLRRFGKVEPLELHAAHDPHAQLFGAAKHAFQNLARTEWVRPFALRAVISFPHEIAKEEWNVVVPWHATMS